MSSTERGFGRTVKHVIRSPWLRVAISAAILAWLCFRVNWGDLLATWRELRWEWWLASLLLSTGTQFLVGFRWRTLARPLGFNDPVLRFVGLQFVGLYFNLFMPSTLGGDVARAWILDGGRGRRARAMISVFVEQSGGMAVLFAMALVSALLSPSDLPEWMLPLVLVVCGGFLAVMLTLTLCARWLKNRLRNTEWRGLQAVQHYAETLADAMAIYWRHRLAFVLSLLLAASMYFLMFVSYWLLSRGLGMTVSLSYFVTIIPLLTAMMWVPISISGIGVREMSLFLFLEPLGVTVSQAGSLGVLSFFNLVLISLIGGLVYSVGLYPKLKPEVAELERISAAV
jgi:glycosyltransferase 2 family protein